MKKSYQRMLVIGLTGGIGMGKSTVADLLRAQRFPVYFADGTVHALLGRGGKAVKPVAKLFPQSFRRSAIDRKILGATVFGKPKELKKLESILHPLVRNEEKEFLRKAQDKKARAAILEIPLLFETKGHKRCDYVICVTVPAAVQMARVLQRPGMNRTKLDAIMARQMPDAQKHKLADFVIDTSGTCAATKKQLQQALRKMLK